MKARKWIIAALLIVILAGVVIFGSRHAAAPAVTKDTTANTTQTKTGSNAFNTSRYSLTDPTSIWVVINKTRPIQPKSWVPGDLVVPDITLRSNITSDERQVRQVNADALKLMAAAAKQEGITLTLESGYRSYNFQVNLYNTYVKQQGQAVADTQSARPGFSEHQTGLAADLGGTSKPACNVEQCYAGTVEGQWLAANAYKFGYVIRYPEGKDSVTGYEYEPWHVRYVGVELATEMHNQGISMLEEFFELAAAPDYR